MAAAPEPGGADGETAAPAVAPRPSAGRQARLDAAVADHAAGRLREAAAAFESLAREGVPAADHNLALMAMAGELADNDPQRARQRLLRAAAAGFVTAQTLLGQLLETGETLFPRDLDAAHRWYARAAAAGSVPAQTAMGTAHYLGRGATRDPARAAHWFRQAAAGGDEGAMYLLASMYERGDGVAQDTRLARHWYAQAAATGDRAAAAKVAEIDRGAARVAVPAPSPGAAPADAPAAPPPPAATARP